MKKKKLKAPKKIKAESKFVKLKARYLVYYRKLPIQKLAAESIGRNEDTIIRWRREDADFADQTQRARARWALNRSGKIKNAQWLLERIMNDHFGKKINVEEKSASRITRADLERLTVEY